MSPHTVFAIARFVAQSALAYWFEQLLVTGRYSAAQHSVFVSLRKHCVILVFSVHPRCVATLFGLVDY